jgi:hypothetical protein
MGASAVQAQQTPAEKFVTQLSARKNEWLIKGRKDSLQQLLDARCQYIHSNGWVQSAAEVVAELGPQKLQYLQIKLSSTTARQFEKMVIVTGRGQFAGKLNGNAFDMELAFTEVYVNRKNGWKLLSRHASRVQ